ncbi:MAG: GNAT family N-acetyltransferase [Planctomycetota bacterium]
MLQVRELHAGVSIEELTGLLHRAYAPLGAMGLNYTAVDQAPEVTAQRIAGGQCFVAELSGRLVGTVVVQPTRAHSECEHYTRAGVAGVHQFAVEPDAQGHGVGRALLEACETWARARRHREIAIDTAEQAQHLVDLYTRFGFARVGHVQWTGKTYRSVVLSKAL